MPWGGMKTAMRNSKVMSASQAIETLVGDRCEQLALGGMHMHNNPMALVRAAARRRVRIERLLTSPSACINADLLLGLGLVTEVVTSYIGFEHLGLAPHFRRAVETGTVRLLEVDEAVIVLGLRAGAGGLPFVALPPGLELADLRKVNPDFYRFTENPYGENPVMTAPPLKPSVAFVHCREADPYGNALFGGSVFTDREMILAADRVILQVERVVATEVISLAGDRAVPGFLVDAVVEAPGGCHPTSSHGEYGYDEAALKEYLKSSRNGADFQAWVARYVDGPATPEEYADLVGKVREAGDPLGG